MDEEDERTVELSSIAAIFPELVIDPSNPFVAILDVAVTPEKPLKIYFQTTGTLAPPAPPTPPTSTDQESDLGSSKAPIHPLANALHTDVHELSHLPPVTLKIELPKEYPVEKPPNVQVDCTPCWLPRKILKDLEEQCAKLWEEYGREQVVYTYIDHVQQAGEGAFGMGGDVQNAVKLSSDLKLALLDYDLKCKREQFEKETFDCGICLEPKKGKDCHRLLLCGHVFCVTCLQDFYNNCISEGDIDNVKCLSPSCGKEVDAEGNGEKKRKINRTLNPSELLQIPIEQEQVQRYVRLKRKKKLESDKTTVYCPRQWCQGAARSKKHPKPVDPYNDLDESDSEPEQVTTVPGKKPKKNTKPEDVPMTERLCICEDCNYAFCSVCKKGWHGELATCNPRRQAELNEEEQASLAYMKKFSTPCPTCNAPSQKTMGCNHMICFKCKTHFCYLCSSYLIPDNPYRHFNDFKSTCYMRLWELEGGDGADAGIGFAGGAGNVEPWEPEDFDSDSDTNPDEETDEEDMAAFDGPGLVDWDADSDSDDDPAPDQRRPIRPHIEIVNFAANGAQQRIELPDQPRNQAPPPVPAPPRRRGHGRLANRQRAAQQEPHRQQVNIGELRRQGVGERLADRPLAAPGQGDNVDMGLQRFLRLAQQDREDEWDSDEEDDDFQVLGPPPPLFVD